MTTAFILKSSALAIILGVAVWAFAHWRAGAVPPVSRLGAEIRNEPEQIAVKEKPIEIDRGKAHYTIRPRYSYHLFGLIVSIHDASGIDISHAKWGDTLNTNDLCVIWGDNAFSGVFQKLTFTSGDWTCYVSTSDSQAWAQFKMNQISNNHLLPSNPQVENVIRDAAIGDQIEIEGFLSDYDLNGHFARGTSITRDDTGNGACETILVTSYRVLDRYNGFWLRLETFAILISALGLVGGLACLFGLPARFGFD